MPARWFTLGGVSFGGPLSAITAAVAGVIVNLALFFAHPVPWPQGLAGPFGAVAAPFGAVAAPFGLAAGPALFRFTVGVIPVVPALRRAGPGWAWRAAALA